MYCATVMPLLHLIKSRLQLNIATKLEDLLNYKLMSTSQWSLKSVNLLRLSLGSRHEQHTASHLPCCAEARIVINLATNSTQGVGEWMCAGELLDAHKLTCHINFNLSWNTLRCKKCPAAVVVSTPMSFIGVSVRMHDCFLFNLCLCGPAMDCWSVQGVAFGWWKKNKNLLCSYSFTDKNFINFLAVH